MKRKPVYLFQQGGSVVPVSAPLYSTTNMLPLVQTASAQVDSGVNTLVAMDQLNMQRSQARLLKEQAALDMSLKREEFQIRREENEVRREALKVQALLGKMDAFTKIMGSMGNTGVSTQQSKQSGISTNWHTLAQENAGHNAEKKVLEGMTNVAKEFDNGKFSFESLLQSKKEQLDAYGENYQKALIQNQYYGKQIEEYKAKSENYDPDLFNHGLNSYYSSTLDQKERILYPSINKDAQEFYKNYIKDRYDNVSLDPGLAQQGVLQIVSHETDVRGQWVEAAKEKYHDQLTIKYGLAKEKGLVEPDENFEEWRDAHLNAIANVNLSPGIKTGSTHFTDEAKGKTGSSGSGSVVAPEVPLNRIGDNKDDSFGVKNKKDIKPIGSTFAPIPGTVETTKVVVPMTTQQKDVLEARARMVTGEMDGDIDMTKYMDAQGRITPAGEEILKQYEGLDISVSKSYIVERVDKKESDSIKELMKSAPTSTIVMNAETGEIMTLAELYTTEGIVNSAAKTESKNAHKYVEENADITGVAKNGFFEYVGDVSNGAYTEETLRAFNMDPYVMTITTDDKEGKPITQTYLIKRDDSFIETNPVLNSQNHVYAQAVATGGGPSKIPQRDLENLLYSGGLDQKEIKDVINDGLFKLIRDVSYEKGSDETLIQFNYGSEKGLTKNIAKGKIIVENAGAINSSLVTGYNISKVIGSDFEFELRHVKEGENEGHIITLSKDGKKKEFAVGFDPRETSEEILGKINSAMDSFKPKKTATPTDPQQVYDEIYGNNNSQQSGEQPDYNQAYGEYNLKEGSGPNFLNTEGVGLKDDVDFSKTSKGFVDNWDKYMHPFLKDVGYTITRAGSKISDQARKNSSHSYDDSRVSNAIDLKDNTDLLKQLKLLNPDITRTEDFKIFELYKTVEGDDGIMKKEALPFIVSYHRNEDTETGKKLDGYHFHFEYTPGGKRVKDLRKDG